MNVRKDLVYEDFMFMEDIEKNYYDEAFITPAKESYECYLHYSKSVLVAEQNGEIMGFLNLFPISNPLFQQIEEGIFNDCNLTFEDIVESDYLFLSCVAVAPHYLGKGVARFLLNQYVDIYQNKKWVIIDTVTKEGEKFAENYGFKFVRVSHHQSKIYKVTFEELRKRAKGD